MPASPIQPFLDQQGVLLLDGALATELEARGADLSGGLWSARVLRERPELIREVHLDYLRAGADCITTASYQASLPGFAERGIDESEGLELLHRSVDLATSARDLLQAESSERIRPLVAASVGPYGAYLADGSEYTGRYGIDEEQLAEFHRLRMRTLAASGADLLACETIPSGVEARALARLLEEDTGPSAWVSFCCRDGRHLADGSTLADAVTTVAPLRRVVAVGINCTAPGFVTSLIEEATEVTDKPIAVYPNSGESWDSGQGEWRSGGRTISLREGAPEWYRAGARLVGGCCRSTPRDIHDLRAALLPLARSRSRLGPG